MRMDEHIRVTDLRAATENAATAFTSPRYELVCPSSLKANEKEFTGERMYSLAPPEMRGMFWKNSEDYCSERGRRDGFLPGNVHRRQLRGQIEPSP